MYKGLADIKCWISLFVIFIIVMPSLGDGNLALSANGASCMGGRYQNTYDSPCTAAIDGTALPYEPHPGNGWVLITLPTVAMVTNLDVVLRSTDGGSGNLHLRVLASDNEDEGINIIGLPAGVYYQPFIFRQPVITNYITLAWEATQMPDILDVRVFGDTQDVSSLDPMKIECDNHQESACADARDNNLLTTIYLASGTTLMVQFGPGEDLTHIAFYSHQQRPESNTVPVTITIIADAHAMDNNVHTMDISYHNQGWNQLSRWQITHLSRPHHTPSNVTIVTQQGAFAAISEMKFFHVRPDTDISHIQQTWPELNYQVDGLVRLSEVYLGSILTTTSPSTPVHTTTTLSEHPEALYTTAHHDDDPEEEPEVTSSPDNLERATTARQQPSTPGIIDKVEASVFVSTLVTMVTASATVTEEYQDDGEIPGTQSPFVDILSPTAGSDPVTEEGELSLRLLPRWFWYLVIIVGVVIIVLVVVLVIILSRMRRRKYQLDLRPRVVTHRATASDASTRSQEWFVNSRPPRVILRSISRTSNPGYTHLALNSQSSILEPYTGVTQGNTTTFGRKKQTDTTECVQCNEDNHCLESERSAHAAASSRPPDDDHELSDDCFEP